MRFHARPVLLLLASLASIASAQPPTGGQPHFERAQELFAEGDLEAASTEIDASYYTTDVLDKAQLVSLLRLRTLVSVALGDDTGVSSALTRLATLVSEDPFGNEASPRVHRMFEEVRVSGVLEVEPEFETNNEGIQLSARVNHDDGSLVQVVRVRARVRGGEWLAGESRLAIPAADPYEVEVAIAALGPGGAVLAEHGTQAAPLRLAEAPASLRPPTPAETAARAAEPSLLESPGQARSRTGLKVGLVILAVAIVAAAIVIPLALRDEGGPSGPMVEF